MEVLFEILLQYGAEFLIQLVVETGAEVGMHSMGKTFRRPKNPVVATLGFAICGLLAGGLSLLLFPHSSITDPTGRRINVIVAPIVAGAAMAVIGSLRRRRGQRLVRLDRFGYAYVFALMMALVRYRWAG